MLISTDSSSVERVRDYPIEATGIGVDRLNRPEEQMLRRDAVLVRRAQLQKQASDKRKH